MSRRHKKILPNFCCSAKLHPDVVVLQSLHFSQALCDHPSSCILWSPPLAVFRLVHMLGFPLHVPFVRPSMFPPPGAVPAPQRPMTMRLLARIRAGEGGWEL